MRNYLYTLLLILFLKNSHAQYVNLNTGILINSFQNSKNLEILNKKITTPTFLIGFDFSKLNTNKNLYLSSQIGYQQIGGKDVIEILDSQDYVTYQKSHFLHTNIIFKYIFLKNKGINTFIGIGPYLNVLLDDKNFTNPVYTGLYNYKRIHIGGKPELGVTADVKRVQIGLIASYLFNITPIANSTDLKLNSRGYGVILSVGHKI